MLTNDYTFLADIFNPETIVGAFFYAVLFFFLALISSVLVRILFHRMIGRTQRPSIDRTAATFVSQMLQVTMFIVASIVYFHIIPALRAIGTAILATAGVTSIVLGLAAQNTLGNIISGFSLLLYRPVRLGDEIKVYASAGDETGVVESITLGYTTLTMSNNEKIIIPNSVLAGTIIVNYGKKGSEK
jgi:small-conductance mechanosensitive channel